MRIRIKINLVCVCLLCHESRTQIFFELIDETLGGTVDNTAQFSILLAWKKNIVTRIFETGPLDRNRTTE